MQDLSGCSQPSSFVGAGNTIATLHCIPVILQNLLFWLFALVAIFAVILIAYSGVRFILSGGDPKQVDSARRTATYAIIGLVLVLLAFIIVNLIGTITGAGNIIYFPGSK